MREAAAGIEIAGLTKAYADVVAVSSVVILGLGLLLFRRRSKI